eukprot:3580878-Amphidinium_carterae.4
MSATTDTHTVRNKSRKRIFGCIFVESTPPFVDCSAMGFSRVKSSNSAVGREGVFLIRGCMSIPNKRKADIPSLHLVT